MPQGKLEIVSHTGIADTFNQLDDMIKGFWFGMICADGCIKRNRQSYCVQLTQSRIHILQQFISDIGYDGMIYTKHTGYGSECHEVRVYDKGFAELLMDMGKVYGKSNQRIPSMPDKMLKGFICGYFEGDGSISLNIGNGQCMLRFSGYLPMLNDIRTEISKYTCIDGGIYNDKSINVLSYSKWDDVFGVAHWMYSDISDDYKYKIRGYTNATRKVRNSIY